MELRFPSLKVRREVDLESISEILGPSPAWTFWQIHYVQKLVQTPRGIHRIQVKNPQNTSNCGHRFHLILSPVHRNVTKLEAQSEACLSFQFIKRDRVRFLNHLSLVRNVNETVNFIANGPGRVELILGKSRFACLTSHRSPRLPFLRGIIGRSRLVFSLRFREKFNFSASRIVKFFLVF